MRMVVILCITLTIFALGLNWGGMLCGIGDMIAQERTVGICTMAITSLSVLIFLHFREVQNDEPSGVFADFSIYAVTSVGLSVALTMLFFSLDGTTSLIGLSPAPLSASSLVIAAIAGAETAQKSRLVDNREYIREGAAMIAVPGCSFVLTYIVFYIIGGESADHLVDFVVMGAAAVILLALVFAGYAHRQGIQKTATERLVNIQQQQIYENSRALNDMELKVVLSENQALHNAVEMKRQEVMNVALSIVEQREYLESLNSLVKQLSMTSDGREKDRLISELGASLRQRLSYDRDIDSQYFYAQAESLHEDFNAKLSENFPDLTQQEKRLATLLRLGFSSKYIATLMNITPKSVEISRYRLRQKLGLSKGENLVNYIKSI
jgi:DNA-binding NarL/FixJ family response regulator